MNDVFIFVLIWLCSGDGMMKMVRSESPPIKKPRLGDSKPELHMPLRIDTERGRSVRDIESELLDNNS